MTQEQINSRIELKKSQNEELLLDNKVKSSTESIYLQSVQNVEKVNTIKKSHFKYNSDLKTIFLLIIFYLIQGKSLNFNKNIP